MNSVVIPFTPIAEIDAVREIEHALLKEPQTRITTHHLIHANLYSRTAIVPAGTIFSTALIKIPTTVIIMGNTVVNIGGINMHLIGYHVIPAGANRKHIFRTIDLTHYTMNFATSARTTEEAEKEFTDEHEMLISNSGVNKNVILVTET